MEVVSEMSRHPSPSSSSTPPVDHTPLTVTGVSTDESTPIVHVSEYTVPMYAGCVTMVMSTVGCGTGERERERERERGGWN